MYLHMNKQVRNPIHQIDSSSEIEERKLNVLWA